MLMTSVRVVLNLSRNFRWGIICQLQPRETQGRAEILPLSRKSNQWRVSDQTEYYGGHINSDKRQNQPVFRAGNPLKRERYPAVLRF